MNPQILDAAETQSRVLHMLEKNPFVSFASFGTANYPDVRMLLVAAQDGVDSIWFATATESKKIVQLRKNPNATLYGCDTETMTEFRLFGHVELLNDSAARQKIWRDDFIEHFPDGIDSPTMIVLHFHTDHGVYENYMKETGQFEIVRQ